MIAPVGLPLAAVKPDNVIILSLVDKLSINPEGYELVVSPKRVSIQALDQPGLFMVCKRFCSCCRRKSFLQCRDRECLGRLRV